MKTLQEMTDEELIRLYLATEKEIDSRADNYKLDRNLQDDEFTFSNDKAIFRAEIEEVK